VHSRSRLATAPEEPDQSTLPPGQFAQMRIFPRRPCLKVVISPCSRSPPSCPLKNTSPSYVCAIAVSCVQDVAGQRNPPQDMGFSMLTPVNDHGTLASIGAPGTQPSWCGQRLTDERQTVVRLRPGVGMHGHLPRGFPAGFWTGCRPSHTGPRGRAAIAGRRRCSN
jgi:hypothetical protein